MRIPQKRDPKTNDTFDKVSSGAPKKSKSYKSGTRMTPNTPSGPNPMINTGDWMLDSTVNDTFEGILLGLMIGNPFVAAAIGAARALNSGAGKKVLNNARDENIDVRDTTSISHRSSRRSGLKCTAQDQPRTPDGKFTFCNHA